MDCKDTTIPNYNISQYMLWDDGYTNYEDGILVIGESQTGKVQFDLNVAPHVLITGNVCLGKSTLLKICQRQMIKKQEKVYVFDFNGTVEFDKQYKNGEVITDRENALKTLEILVKEMEYRMKIFREFEVKNLKEYNAKTDKNLKRIGVFCDDIFAMFNSNGAAEPEKELLKNIETCLYTIAKLSRPVGINLFFEMQRPDSNILTGQIKNNIPIRITGRLNDKLDSESMLGNDMATELPNTKGRFLFKLGNEITEFQSYHIDQSFMSTDSHT